MPLTAMARRLFAVADADQPVSIESTDDIRRLSRLLGVSPDTLLRFRRGRPEGFHYHPLWVKKHDGTLRRIDAPSPLLKALQRDLLHGYLDALDLHPAAMGFRRGYSIADHARAHVGQALVATADVEDFFGTTTIDRVRAWYRALNWDAVAISVLTGLTTWRGVLPQGAPTSPALSNLVNYDLDASLTALVVEEGGRYTRYGDDLAFSWPTERGLSGIEARVRALLLAHGYRLHPSKGWCAWHARRGEQPCLTGVLLGRDGRLHPSQEVAQAMRHLRRHRGAGDRRARLQGYRGFLRMLR